MKSSQYDHITDELLSAYLDDAVTNEEREQIEAAITADPEVAWRLESLRQTVLLLQQLPEVAPPRSFVLHEAQIADVIGDQVAVTQSEPPIRVRPAASRRGQTEHGWWAQLTAGWRAFWQPGNPWLRNAAAVSFVLLLALLVATGQFPGAQSIVPGYQSEPSMAVLETAAQDGAGEQVALAPETSGAEAAPAAAESAPDSEPGAVAEPAEAPADAVAKSSDTQPDTAEESAVEESAMVESAGDSAAEGAAGGAEESSIAAAESVDQPETAVVDAESAAASADLAAVPQDEAQPEASTEEEADSGAGESAAAIASLSSAPADESQAAQSIPEEEPDASAPAIAMTGPVEPQAEMQFERPYDPSAGARAMNPQQPEGFPPVVGDGLGGGSDQPGAEIIEPEAVAPEIAELEAAESSDDAPPVAQDTLEAEEPAPTATVADSPESAAAATEPDRAVVAVEPESDGEQPDGSDLRVDKASDDMADEAAATLETGTDVDGAESVAGEAVENDTEEVTPQATEVRATSTPAAIAVAPQPRVDNAGKDGQARQNDVPAQTNALTAPLLVIHLALALFTVTLGILWWRSRPQ